MSLPLDKAETEKKKKLISCFIDSFLDKSLKSRLSSFLDKDLKQQKSKWFFVRVTFPEVGKRKRIQFQYL